MAKKNKQKSGWLGLLLVAASPVVGYLGASYFLNGGSKSIDINGLEIILIILLMLLVFFLVILIHEIGHILGGLIMGNEFSMMIVGPLKLQKEDDQYQLTFNRDIAMAGGLALTLPKKTEGFKKRRLAVIGGGPLASILLTIVAYLIFLATSAPNNKLLSFFLLGLGVFSGLAFLMTIIPMKVGGFMTDGMQILMTLRNDEKAKQYADFMHLFALENQGVMPKDLPAAFFTKEQDKPIEDSIDLAFQQYLFYRALDKNDLTTAENLLQKMESKIDIYPPNFHAEMQANWFLFYSLVQPNEKRADEVLTAMDGKKPSMSKISLHAFEAAVAFNNGDMKTAKAFAQEVLNSKDKKGTTKLYQRILQKALN